MSFSLVETFGLRFRHGTARAVRDDLIHYRKREVGAPGVEGMPNKLDEALAMCPYPFRVYVDTPGGSARVTSSQQIGTLTEDVNPDRFLCGVMLITPIFRLQGMFPTEVNEMAVVQLNYDDFGKHISLMNLVDLEAEFRAIYRASVSQ